MKIGNLKNINFDLISSNSIKKNPEVNLLTDKSPKNIKNGFKTIDLPLKTEIEKKSNGFLLKSKMGKDISKELKRFPTPVQMIKIKIKK